VKRVFQEPYLGAVLGFVGQEVSHGADWCYIGWIYFPDASPTMPRTSWSGTIIYQRPQKTTDRLNTGLENSVQQQGGEPRCAGKACDRPAHGGKFIE